MLFAKLKFIQDDCDFHISLSLREVQLIYTILNLFTYSPVIIEVPHFASLRGKQREIIVLRSDNGETWKEHTLESNEEAIQDVLNHSFEGDGMFKFYCHYGRWIFFCFILKQP